MKKRRRAKVFVGMSGGVDSSVAAALLLHEGHDVVGVHIKCWSPTGDCGVQDAEDARRVAEKLGIPFYVWNFEDEYKAKVVDYMIEGYRRGLTPNPDIMCNREIKFGIFLEKSLRLGADYVATGHYVKIKKQELKIKNKDTSCHSLFTAEDARKDQSYFLWTLTQKQLAHCLFPIGGFEKKRVREMAKKFDLPTAEKKDSQGICFMGHITIDEFLRDYISQKPGAIVTTEGKTIGEHQGIYPYTIGQRHGIRVGGTGPYYVTKKELATNTLVVAKGSEAGELQRTGVELSDVNFVRDFHASMTGGQVSVLARVRYRQPLFSATLKKVRANVWRLEFSKPQKFVAEGQSAVFYAPDGEMIGGGIIAD